MLPNSQASIAADRSGKARISRISEIIQISGAILLGLVLMFGVGFAQARFAHDIAHDSRHSVSFPCH